MKGGQRQRARIQWGGEGSLYGLAVPPKADTRYVLQPFAGFHGPRHYVLGNHCVARLSKAEFLTHCGAEVKRSYYSFDSGPCHFVVLDANFKQDGTPYAAGNFTWTDTWIPKDEQEWLADDLGQTTARTTLVFVHQNLDKEDDAHGVKNAAEVRAVLEQSGSVAAVFQGHMHGGGYRRIGEIHYCTLRAMVERPTVENNAYAIVTVDRQGQITLEGLGRQPDVDFA